MSEPITIILVDDHSMVRMGLRTYFNTLPDIEVMAEADNGQAALRLVSRHAPDVVLMDLLMPCMDGVETTRLIKQSSPRTQVIVLTSYHDDEHIFSAIRAGALSYVLKDIQPDRLADAIRRAHRGEAVLHPNVAARLIQEMRGTGQDASGPITALTNREMEILKLIASGKNNQEIAEGLTISQRTVKSHISNVLSKLHLSDRTKAAVYAWQAGIVGRTSAGN